MGGKTVVENYIEIDGKDVPMDSLPEEKRKEIAELLSERIMEAAGYIRKGRN